MRVRVPLSEQISYMERHREKGEAMVKDNPGMQRAVDVSQAIIMSLAAYQAFEHEMNAKERTA
jgi:hypothetical protein